GTLDPMATGFLQICFGSATKIEQYLLYAYKEYIATIRLGIETDIGDAECEIIAKSIKIPELSAEYLEIFLAKFRGDV
ncbi:tRNA pseudouridine(55) synthase TruB, partial [Francisella tularensis subsp. holarctica]|nr:tRNA pseudouridine(55) synthase TruB [Francisella tularensis subsp. holarctica]